MTDNKKRNHQSLKHPNADQVAIWVLRIMLELEGWRSLSGFFSSYTCDCDLLRAVDLGHLEDTDIEKDDFLNALKSQQTKFAKIKIKSCPTFTHNLKRLKKLAELSKTEVEVLKFAITIHSQRGLENAASLLDNLSAGGVIYGLSVILEIPEHKIRKAFSNNGNLARSGLLRFSKGEMEKMRGRLSLMEGLCNILFAPQTGDLLSQYFISAKAANLNPSDYEYIHEDYQLIKQYLLQGKKQNLNGINILVYGQPGTGKSELARTLSADLGLQLFEISTVDEDGTALNGKSRFAAYQLSQQVLAQRQNALILFDEIEDVFPNTDCFFSNPATIENQKAWINRQLEENPVPAIWISNEIGQIDKAYIRRFDFVLNLEHPPKNVREAILNKYLKEVPVTKQWIKNAAENQNLAPAIISRAARVVSIVNGKQNVEQQLEQVMSNTLGAMGYSKQLMQPKNAHEQVSYRLDALNPDRDINKLVEGLKKHPQGRFCLYGPPGTGKTAFGHYIAKELGQKLLIKRASNILNAYVGGTEKGIADMFKQAQIDKSILMLDEADSFLQNRNNARHNWEITQVNELLTQMEDFDGLFICSTNLVDALDGASIRRFDLKIKFDYLLPDQAWVLFQQTLQDMNNPVDPEDHWKTELAKICNLTPGDFATVVRQNKLSEEVLTPETLLQELSLEASFKQQPAARGIGFTANF